MDKLERQLGVGGAALLGLGSMVGTGVFVSIGLAAGVTGASVIVAIAIAAVVATCNALSSAQLAANHPVSGGTYEYGYRYLKPVIGFTAGWMFLVAKSASAATAALGFSSYVAAAVPAISAGFVRPMALTLVVILTIITAAGIRRSAQVNLIIVAVTIATLVFLIVSSFDETR